MLIRNAALLTGERADLRFADGRIEEMGRLTARAGEKIFDAAGLTCCPGFVDIHTHGYGGADTMQGRAAVAHMAEELPKHGVTSFLPTTMTDSIERTRQAVAGAADLMRRPIQGARVLGCHMEGPFINPLRKGAQPAQYVMKPTLAAYEAMTGADRDCVRLMTVAPEMEGGREFITALSKEIPFSAGHTDADAETILASCDWGVNQITHLFNGMNPFNHRTPGVPGAALLEDRLYVQMICDFIHLHPQTVALAIRLKGADKCLLITDAMEAAGMPDGEYTLGINRVFVKNGEARLAEGNLAGSTLTMDKAVRNVVSGLGLPLAQAVAMATCNPARAIRDGEHGLLRAGGPADCVLLDKDLAVAATAVGGEFVYVR